MIPELNIRPVEWLVLHRLSSGASVLVGTTTYFLIQGELTYYWLDNKGNYYSEEEVADICSKNGYTIIDDGHRVFN